MRQRIGIYPGTFDPVHQGHLAFAAEAMRQCKLDEILFLPEASPRGKPEVSPIDVRIASLVKVVQTLQAAKVIRLDHSQFTTARTLPALMRLCGNAELTLLVGSDVARTLSYRWDDLDILLRSTSLAIGLRAGDTHEQMTAIILDLQDRYDLPISCKLIKTEYDTLSSTQLRNERAALQ
jgi:nicotinate-nucleotide adenylyltransferase